MNFPQLFILAFNIAFFWLAPVDHLGLRVLKEIEVVGVNSEKLFLHEADLATFSTLRINFS